MVTLLLCVWVGCVPTPRTEIVVALTSDLTEGVDFGQATLHVEVPSGRTIDVGMAVGGADGVLPGTFALEWLQGALGLVAIEPALELAGENVLSARVETEFVREQSRLLTIALDRACLGVSCAAAERCRDGTCERSHVQGSELPEWTGAVPAEAGSRGD